MLTWSIKLLSHVKMALILSSLAQENKSSFSVPNMTPRLVLDFSFPDLLTLKGRSVTKSKSSVL